MKQSNILTRLLVVVAIVAMVVPCAFAAGRVPPTVRDQTNRSAADSFTTLSRQTNNVSFTGSNYITPADSTSTGTYATPYQGSEVTPFLLRVQNTGTAYTKLYYTPYSSLSAGVATTSTSMSFLANNNIYQNGSDTVTANVGMAPGETWEKVFYDDPNLTFGTTGTFSFEIWTPPAAFPYNE